MSSNTHTHTRPFNGPLSGTTRVGRYQKGKTNLDFAEARDSEWQWHQLGHMQVCTSLQTDNHASTSPLSFLQAGCPSCRPTNSVKALKAIECHLNNAINLRRLTPHIMPRYTHNWRSYRGRGFCASLHPVHFVAFMPSSHCPIRRDETISDTSRRQIFRGRQS